MSGNGTSAQSLSTLMSGTWIEFARIGNPNRAGLPQRHAYDLANRWTMSFDGKSSRVRTRAVASAPRGANGLYPGQRIA